MAATQWDSMGRIADTQRAARTLVIDIETGPNLAWVWGLWDQNVSLTQLEQPSHVMCFAAKWVGKRQVMFHSEHHDGRDAMVAAAWRLLDEADAVIGYNSKGFDVKHLHREFVLAGMPPPSPHKDIDLLTVARSRFKFVSNKLDHVANELGVGSKLKHQGFDMWRKCIDGDEGAWRTMKRYNVQDVRLTERVYERLLPWIKNHPHPGLYGGDRSGCPNCGGRLEAVPDRTTNTASRVYDLLRCVDCGANARPAKATPNSATETRGV